MAGGSVLVAQLQAHPHQRRQLRIALRGGSFARLPALGVRGHPAFPLLRLLRAAAAVSGSAVASRN